MKYNELKTKRVKSVKRVGRGIAAGQGKTAGRGTKGQMARTGARKKPGFAGGQNPLMQQLPKLPGFRSHRLKSELVYTGQLDQFANQTVDNELLAKAGIISNSYAEAKLLLKGQVTKNVAVKLQRASQNAIAAVQQVGGSFEKVDRVLRPKTTEKKNK
jgi:large subunit ribosomal protein L15